jgi:hypothetical protein
LISLVNTKLHQDFLSVSIAPAYPEAVAISWADRIVDLADELPLGGGRFVLPSNLKAKKVGVIRMRLKIDSAKRLGRSIVDPFLRALGIGDCRVAEIGASR